MPFNTFNNAHYSPPRQTLKPSSDQKNISDKQISNFGFIPNLLLQKKINKLWNRRVIRIIPLVLVLET